MRYLIDFSYDGSKFSGYQKQPNLRSVQEEIEKVLSNINDSYVNITASGRTDKGVNALHQKAHFDLNKKISCYKLKGALNSYLSDDIYINSVIRVNDDFHARYDVKLKSYVYRINLGNYNPLERNYIYQYCKSLDIKSIKESFKYLIGTHDFTTFVSAEDKKENKIRTITDISLDLKDDILSITFEGNGFLKYQIRNMVGLLIRIGENKENKENIPLLLEAKDRRVIYKTAPACGLTLLDVKYK